jgi:uncharacterized protein (TIGR00369 family)
MSEWPTREEREPCTHQMGGDGILAHLGLRVTPRRSTQVAVECDVRPDLTNPAGMLQGGIIATIVDVAGGIAAARAADARLCFTSDLTTHFLSAGRVGPVRAEARILRHGRSTVVVAVRVIDTGADDRLMATSTLTMVTPSRSS